MSIARGYVLIIVITQCCLSAGMAQSAFSDLDILVGLWQVEGRQQFEEWAIDSSSGLTGRVYRISDGDTSIIETIRLYRLHGIIIYEPTVPDQNAGEAIPFVLNPNLDSCWSFENPDHDFPNIIQYCAITPDTLSVHVRGVDGNGFTLRQMRVR